MMIEFTDGNKRYTAWLTSDGQVSRMRVTSMVTSWKSRHRRLISREVPLERPGKTARRLLQLALERSRT